MNDIKRHPTSYPGIFYRIVDRLSKPGKERMYYARYTRGGKKLEEKLGRQHADNLTPAKCAAMRADLIEGRRKRRTEIREDAKKKKWTLNTLWDDYCEVSAGNKGMIHEKNRWKHNVEDVLGKKEPHQLSPIDFDRLRMNLQKAGKLTTAVRVLELIRRAINYGIKRNLVDPIRFKIALPSLNNQTTEDLSDEELTRLIKALDNDHDQAAANVMRLALYAGMRRSEILGLAWDAVDFERGFITIRDPKGGRDQTIPLNAAARKVIESQPRDPESPWVFPGRREGKHATEFRASINRIRKAAGLPAGFRPLHGLRHAFASRLASSGQVDMYTLQKLLTHKSPVMTQRYAHLRDDALRKASELAGTLVDDAVKAEAEKDESATG